VPEAVAPSNRADTRTGGGQRFESPPLPAFWRDFLRPRIARHSRGLLSCTDEYERRWRAGGARPAIVEDAGLAELARKLAPVRPTPEAQAASEYDRWGAAPIEAETPHSATAFVRRKPSGPARRDLEATQTSGFVVPCSHDPRYSGPATGRRSGRWTRTLAPAGAALLFGAAMFVAVFGPKGGSTGALSHITQPGAADCRSR
jgi:hypothetical protein